MNKIFIISLMDSGTGIHQQSALQILPHTLHCCKKYSWNVEIFKAVNGFSICDADWHANELAVPKIKPNKFGGKPGAQGCFLSHYRLWQKCVELNEPIIVLEDDAEVVAPLVEFNTTQDLIKLHKPSRINEHPTMGTWGPGAYAYWLSPNGATKLINFSKSNGPKYTDKMIGSNILQWNHLSTPIVKLGPRVGSSTNPEKYPLRISY